MRRGEIWWVNFGPSIVLSCTLCDDIFFMIIDGRRLTFRILYGALCRAW
jgi:hypothetical protein